MSLVETTGIYAPFAHSHAVATPLADGFMSALDKTKLDAVSPGWKPIGSPLVIFTPGAAATITNIPQTFSELLVTLEGGSHTGAADASIFMQISTNNGSSFSSGSAALSYTVSATTIIDGAALFSGNALDRGLVTATQTESRTSADPGGVQ